MGSNPSTESNYKTAVNNKNKMQMLCMRKETTAQRDLQQKYVATLATRCIGEMRVRNTDRPRILFYLNDATHGRRQQLCDLALANNSIQEWYQSKELFERSPTLPRTYQAMVGNDGNSPENLTVNSTRVRETKVNNRENLLIFARLLISSNHHNAIYYQQQGIRHAYVIVSIDGSRD
ncbi:pentatricopeptide repeat-containing protein [Dorcoceras hygrometricum]|uniref:Pentatricopeptide repeat-containing protein n=1 Tax=Dorcoceras hygrometricum TaxID=472368 RepID=A0A2Z7ARR2_9LAMI|nr:pentatricopeptide repeat-containing protein [Dorcoceras hygrometricum]